MTFASTSNPEPKNKMVNLREEIEAALNRCCAEQESNTPDFILAQFLIACLAAWDAGVNAREEWYGRRSSRPVDNSQPTQIDE